METIELNVDLVADKKSALLVLVVLLLKLH